jgi:hypothetical protein
MDGVRLVARTIGMVAWGALAIGAVGLLALGLQLSRVLSSPMGMALPILALIGLALGTLGPFFLWAVLTGLCELHDQGERILDTIKTLEFSVDGDSEATPSAGTGQKPSPASAARHFGWNG